VAFGDAADLLDRAKRLGGVPTTTEFPADADWYAWITEAHAHWVAVIAAQAPWAMTEAPILLTSADSGETYTFAGSISPLTVELYDTKDGRLLAPAGYHNSGGDYVWEGDKIRFPGGVKKTFSNGPYARYITPPTTVDGSTAPTLKPAYARVLLVVPRAVAFWAERGGMRDPTAFYRMETKAWMGDPERGDIGVLGQLKMSNPWLGLSAYPPRTLAWWESISTGSGYSTYP
jgi:hypothetical protein